MPAHEHTGHGAPDSGLAPGIALPLVSVVVVNYNYGRFLRALVDSVAAQTYPHVECILVDNASTDETADVLAALEAEGRPVTILRRAGNDGQTPASLDGLARASGAYVIFVDADDLLLPGCVAAHVTAHLTLRAHVGFTSGDMLQVADGQVVVAGGEAFGAYIRRRGPPQPRDLRPFRHDDCAALAAAAATLEGRIHRVPPLQTRWIWSPTSGNCYRRDALLLFADNPALAGLRTGTDMYFAHAIGALSGSALIDEPLFAYRIHGGNIYTQRAQLDRTLPFVPGGSGDSNARARLFIVDHLVAAAPRFAPNVWLRLYLAWLLVRLDLRDPDAPGWRRSRLAGALVTHEAVARKTLGPALFGLLRLWSGAALRRRHAG